MIFTHNKCFFVKSFHKKWRPRFTFSITFFIRIMSFFSFCSVTIYRLWKKPLEFFKPSMIIYQKYKLNAKKTRKVWPIWKKIAQNHIGSLIDLTYHFLIEHFDPIYLTCQNTREKFYCSQIVIQAFKARMCQNLLQIVKVIKCGLNLRSNVTLV